MSTSDRSLAGQLRALGRERVERVLAGCTPEELAALQWAWREFWLRPDERAPGAIVGTGQIAPPGDWIYWVVQGPRGAGKSQAASCWYQEEAERLGPGFVGIVLAQTVEKAREIIVEGPSGLLNVAPPWARPTWKPSVNDGVLEWPNGATAFVYSADKEAKARGPNFNRWWIDDPPAFGPSGYAVFETLASAFRLTGHGLKCVVATTPPQVSPPPKSPELLDFFLMPQFDAGQKDFVYSISGQDANAGNLDAATMRVVAPFAGSANADAERRGVYNPKAIGRVFGSVRFDAAPVAIPVAPASLRWVAVWIDPSLSSSGNPCEVGIVAVGATDDGHGVILEDASGVYTSQQWPTVALDLLERWQPIAGSCHLGVETNRKEAQSEALLNFAQVIRAQARGLSPIARIPITTVHTAKSKAERASLLIEPALRGLVHVVVGPGTQVLIAQLRDLSEQTKSGPGRDRADAAVYGLLDVFGMLDKVRPGSLLAVSYTGVAGALGGGRQGSIVVSGDSGREDVALTMAEPAAMPYAGAFGRRSW